MGAGLLGSGWRFCRSTLNPRSSPSALAGAGVAPFRFPLPSSLGSCFLPSLFCCFACSLEASVGLSSSSLCFRAASSGPDMPCNFLFKARHVLSSRRETGLCWRGWGCSVPEAFSSRVPPTPHVARWTAPRRESICGVFSHDPRLWSIGGRVGEGQGVGDGNVLQLSGLLGATFTEPFSPAASSHRLRPEDQGLPPLGSGTLFLGTMGTCHVSQDVTNVFPLSQRTSWTYLTTQLFSPTAGAMRGSSSDPTGRTWSSWE